MPVGSPIGEAGRIGGVREMMNGSPHDVTATTWLKMGITYLVPYCVSTYSAVAVVRQACDYDALAIARIEEE